MFEDKHILLNHDVDDDVDNDSIDEIDMKAVSAFFVTNYRDDQIDITTKNWYITTIKRLRS